MPLVVAVAANEGVLDITLTGELDAKTYPLFEQELNKVTVWKFGRVVLRIRELTYMASKGVRALLAIQQRIGGGVEVNVIEPQPEVRELIKDAGLDRSWIILES